MSASWFDQVPPESEEDKQQRDLRIRIACGEEVEDFQSGRFKRKGGKLGEGVQRVREFRE